ncbi:hypothetical protein [Burkholderia stagnalis]|uniref:hypothetical protein n=1 Tax=Burkholderia stagnalis TaxID=1503054 RepID=UPI0035D475CF
MQVLSDDIRRRLSCKAVDLHHSFSPGFKGAKPFHQPFERSDLPDFSGPLPAAAAELVRVVVPSTGQRTKATTQYITRLLAGTNNSKQWRRRRHRKHGRLRTDGRPRIKRSTAS